MGLIQKRGTLPSSRLFLAGTLAPWGTGGKAPESLARLGGFCCAGDLRLSINFAEHPKIADKRIDMPLSVPDTVPSWWTGSRLREKRGDGEMAALTMRTIFPTACRICGKFIPAMGVIADEIGKGGPRHPECQGPEWEVASALAELGPAFQAFYR